jgi:hypothetical protein
MMATLLMNASILLSSAVWAHKPSFSDGRFAGPDQALRIADVDLSQVVYHEATDEAPYLWLTFEGQAGQKVDLQIGLPVIDRLKDLRPAVALIGPGLPEVDVPFEVPEGMGGEIVRTDDVEKPRFFYERFTGTNSWILRETAVTVPQNGQYFLVGYLPSGETDKFWVAVGTREDWGVSDLGKLPGWTKKVRRFHEVGGWPRLQKIAGGVGAAVVAGLTWLIVNLLRK